MSCARGLVFCPVQRPRFAAIEINTKVRIVTDDITALRAHGAADMRTRDLSKEQV